MSRMVWLMMMWSFSTAPVAQDHGGDSAVRLYGAGSLRYALTDVAKAFEARFQTPVATTFAPSGLLRQRIEAGEPVDVFASANLAHPQRLRDQGRGDVVVLFARNQLCALARAEVVITPATVLDVLLDPAVRLGTSTPKADPAGDYAWELFHKAETLRPGSYQPLDAKALQLTGGPDSPKAPAGRNPYAWVMENDRADVFLTYCTNAKAALAESPTLQMVQLPENLAVGADYGLILLAPHRPAAVQLALFILSPEAQALLAQYGFTSALLPAPD
ncbi:MAG: molybdate ABC transporter substrate-binding protein [Candidatus Competibacterales bacterium]